MINDIEYSNKLNNAPIDTINVEDIIKFCETKREEGIDLDYKSNWPSDLEKVICSFANTQGGIVLIGIDEEEKTRKPKLPISGIEGEQSTIYQKVMNIASDAIYPPISPEVRICQLPNQKEKYIVLVRILPSRLLHSTDRRRKIYIRVADNNRGYDLATVSDLEWLWERKLLIEEKRKETYLSAISHSSSNGIPWNSPQDEQHWNTIPKLQISIIPSFPNPDKLIEPDRLLEVVRSLQPVRSKWKNVDRTIPLNSGQWRSIPGGVCSSTRGSSRFLQFIEFGQLAHFHTSIGIETITEIDGNTFDFEFTHAYIILAYIDISLKFAYQFYNLIEYTWPITVDVTLDLQSLLKINYSIPGRNNPFRSELFSRFATDKALHLLNIEIAPFQINDDSGLMSSTAHNLFWAFGLGWDRSRADEWLAGAAS